MKADKAMKFEVYKADKGEFRWRLVNANGSVVQLPKAPPVSRGAGARVAFRNVQSALGTLYNKQAG